MPGRLLLPPDARSPAPLLLLALDVRATPALDALAAGWAAAGAAVASIDLPLHGARASAKLGEILAGRPGEPPSALAAGIGRELARQAVADLRRCLDALARAPAIDPARIAFAGLGLGARAGAAFCAADPRPRAAAFGFAAAGGGIPELDPAGCVARIAPRPLLLVNAARDPAAPREAALRLHAAAGEPREQRWLEPGGDLVERALEAMGAFLGRELGLA